MKAFLIIVAAVYGLSLALILALAADAARRDRRQRRAPDWWAELDAEPQTGVCATCRKPVTRGMAWCDAACQVAWGQS